MNELGVYIARLESHAGFGDELKNESCFTLIDVLCEHHIGVLHAEELDHAIGEVLVCIQKINSLTYDSSFGARDKRYIDGTFNDIQHVPYYMSLLVNSIVKSCIESLDRNDGHTRYLMEHAQRLSCASEGFVVGDIDDILELVVWSLREPAND